MNFDVIENLSDEDILELYYEDILNIPDTKACYCMCNGAGIADYRPDWGCANWYQNTTACYYDCRTGCRNWVINKRLSGSCNCICGGSTINGGDKDPTCYCT